jgi:exopolysaccharide biosynthesis polyprenyl glycosylphosphotransferase
MFFRKIVNDGIVFTGLEMFFPNFNFSDSLVLFLIYNLFFYYLSGFYLHPHRQSALTVTLSTFISSIVISITIFFVLLLDDIVISYKNYYYGLFALFIIHFVLTCFVRLIITLIAKHHFKKKKWTFNTIIIGSGKVAERAKKELEKRVFVNTFRGFIPLDNRKNKKQTLGHFDEISKIISENYIREVVIGIEEIETGKLSEIINKLFTCNVDIFIVPELYKHFSGNVRIIDFGKNPFASLTSSSMSDCETCVKRFFDVLFSSLALIILSPLIGIFSILIKKESNGPVFYLQERIGKNGIPFNIVKFRTMYADAENGIPQLSSPTDARVTKIGVILRKYRLDEIPQFWNVIIGEMSLVGPRPERQYYIDKIMKKAPYYCLLYKIRPGLTSWGPIKIGYSDTLKKMIERLNYDMLYMDNMSLLNDFKILVLTVEIIFKGKGV